MRTGRPPRTIEERRRDGTLRSHHAKTPVVVAGRPSRRPSCPAWLSTEGKRAFRRIVQTLWDAGFLDKADELLIAIAADALGDAVAAAKDCNARGLTIEVTRITRSGDAYTVTEKNPSYQVKADALTRFHQTCAELGIGPVARARLANLGIKGKVPAQTLPGVGAKPTPLRVVGGEDER